MIVGLGTDIVAVERIDGALSRLGNAFAARILTPIELDQMQASGNPTAFLARRFAAKEAAVKALGTGIGRGIGWQQFEIKHSEAGAPRLVLSGNAKAHCESLGVTQVWVSISDEHAYATATVILER